jgi:hypothetical protein
MSDTKTKVKLLKTKSGTAVYVVGNPKSDYTFLNKVGQPVIQYYNKDFTVQEQRRIGNIFYDVYGNKNNEHQVPLGQKDFNGRTSQVRGEVAKQLNCGKKKMIELFLTKSARDKESIIVHELVHAKNCINATHSNHENCVNELRTDFEMVGRVTQKGLRKGKAGSIYTRHPTKQETKLIKENVGTTAKDKWQEWRAFLRQNVLDDRILITGSLKNQLKGKAIEDRVKKTFKQSAIRRPYTKRVT